MSKFKYLKEEVYEANMEIPKQHLAIYTFGNVSAIDRSAGIVGIKPSGVPYAELKPKDIVLMDLENRVVAGKKRPSSDTKTHILLYKNFETIGGICHTHETYSQFGNNPRRSFDPPRTHYGCDDRCHDSRRL
jgi:L-ribulose-5-phosphate 4-epimerase